MKSCKKSLNSHMPFGVNCPCLIMEFCPMISNMCAVFKDQMIANEHFKDTYIKVKGVPISELVD